MNRQHKQLLLKELEMVKQIQKNNNSKQLQEKKLQSQLKQANEW